ncbi:MAG: hypothetical protein ACFFG0_12015 [Candidatus Thorarchaeota archaeon]
MNLEKFFLEIIKATGLSREEIHEMIDNTKRETNNPISDERALLIIAKNLCVDIY